MPRLSGQHPGVLLICFMAGLLVSGCSVEPTVAPEPTACNGIDAAIGGCDADLPTFAGMTCEGVGAEAGIQLDPRLRAIYNGPAEADGESQAVRAAQATSLTVSLANRYLRATGVVNDCTAKRFLAAMAAQFSEEVRQKAGDYVYDGKPVTYEEFLADIAKTAAIIDMAR